MFLISRCEVHPGGGDVVLDQFDVLVSDGGWHEVHLEVTMDKVSISLDNLVMSQTLHRQIRTGTTTIHYTMGIWAANIDPYLLGR